MRRALCWAGVAVLAAAAALLGVPATSVAAGSTCTGTPNSLFAGLAGPYSEEKYGSQGDIEFSNPDLCGNDVGGPGDSLAWVMIYTDDTSGRQDYAQVGWGQFGWGPSPNGSTFATFSQWTKLCATTGTCTGVRFVTQYGIGPTDTLHYQVKYLGGTGGDNRFHMWAGGDLLDISTFDPRTNWPDHWWRNEFSGETHYPESDVPGVDSNRLHFSHLQTQTTSSGASWGDVNLMQSTWQTIPYQPDRYHRNKLTDTGFQIWTDPL